MNQEHAPLALVAGHICLDITPTFPGQAPVESLARLLTPGGLVSVGAADVHTGGCVANTGLALQQLGVRTRLVAKVGQDAFGALLGELLATEGADCTLLPDTAASTSYSIVLAPPGVDRVFLHNPGANEAFEDADVPDALLSGAALLHIGYPPLMRRLCADGGAQLLRLLTRARAHGVVTSMDMAAIDPASPAAALDWHALLARLMPLVDFFLPSAEELCFMLDRPRHAQWLSRAHGGDVMAALDLSRDVAPLCDALIAMGCKVAVVKCGARGMVYQTADAHALRSLALPLDASAWANQAGIQPSFRPRRLVSATGAGDTSIAAFLASALAGCPLTQCLQRAAATGACCVEAYDALSGLLSLSQLDQRIASGWDVQL